MFKQKDKQTLNKSIDMLRITVVAVLFGAFILLFFLRLVKLQVVDKDYYASIAVPKTYREQKIEMSRGQIFDRNGNLLVANKKSYNISISKATLDGDDYNTTLYEFIKFCIKHNIVIEDKLPISLVAPFELDNEYIFDEDKEKMLNKFIKNNNLDANKLLGNKENLYTYLHRKYTHCQVQREQQEIWEVYPQ